MFTTLLEVSYEVFDWPRISFSILKIEQIWDLITVEVMWSWITWTNLGHRTWHFGLVRLLHRHPEYWNRLFEDIYPAQTVWPLTWRLPVHSRTGRDPDHQLFQGSRTAQRVPDWEKVRKVCRERNVNKIHLPLSKHVSELGHGVGCVELHPKCPGKKKWSMVTGQRESDAIVCQDKW